MAHKILLVDDEILILEEAAEILIDEGYDCIGVDSVDAALKALADSPDIVLVITDLMMPKKTGTDLIKAVREGFDREIKFIVMSGHGSPSVQTGGVNIEDYPFVRKPLDIENFLATIAAELAAA